MKRDLTIRYLAYALMLAVVVAALAGVLERESAVGSTAREGARAEYPRVTRQGLKPSLVVEVHNRGAGARAPSVTLASGYLEALQLGAVTPDPDEAAPVGDGLVRYTFAPLAGGDSLRAVFAFSIDQQVSGVRFSSPLRVALGTSVLLDARARTVVIP